MVRAQYEEQLNWAVEEGIDFVIAETNDYLGEALIGLDVIKQLGLPAMVTLASVQPEQTRDGYDYVEACKILADHGADIVGLNCDRGPATMLPLIEKIRATVSCYVAAQPVPYRTHPLAPTFEALELTSGTRAFPLALEPFLLNRFEMADFARQAARWASIISASAVAARHIMCGPWPRRWAAPRPPARTLPPWNCTPCWAHRWIPRTRHF